MACLGFLPGKGDQHRHVHHLRTVWLLPESVAVPSVKELLTRHAELLTGGSIKDRVPLLASGFMYVGESGTGSLQSDSTAY